MHLIRTFTRNRHVTDRTVFINKNVAAVRQKRGRREQYYNRTRLPVGKWKLLKSLVSTEGLISCEKYEMKIT